MNLNFLIASFPYTFEIGGILSLLNPLKKEELNRRFFTTIQVVVFIHLNIL